MCDPQMSVISAALYVFVWASLRGHIYILCWFLCTCFCVPFICTCHNTTYVEFRSLFSETNIHVLLYLFWYTCLLDLGLLFLLCIEP